MTINNKKMHRIERHWDGHAIGHVRILDVVIAIGSKYRRVMHTKPLFFYLSSLPRLSLFCVGCKAINDLRGHL